MHDPSAPKPFRLVVAEGHALFRAGLRYLLQDLAAHVDLQEAATASELWRALAQGPYDLVLVDHTLPGEDGTISIRQILDRAGPAPVAVVSGSDDPGLIRRVLDDGAAGFIPKNSSPRLMIQALHLILAGGVYVPASILSLLPKIAVPEDGMQARRVALTARQQQVWDQLAKGASNKHIARSLGLSEGAVKAHVAGLLRLLGARNRAEALVRAGQAGWLDGETTGGSPRSDAFSRADEAISPD